MYITHHFTTIKKRNNTDVPFEAEKIHRAITNAFRGIRKTHDGALCIEITNKVLTHLVELVVGRVPTVEEIQNMVERVLMDGEYVDVAKAYIIYRYEHEKIREKKQEEIIEKAGSGGLTVVKRDGSVVPFSLENIRRRFSYVIEKDETVIDIDGILAQIQREVFDGMTTVDVERTLIMVVRTMIEQDPAYSYVAARLVIAGVNKDILGAKVEMTDQALRDVFKVQIRKAVIDERLDPRLLVFDIDRLAKELDFSR
ncbi:MAG: hypothetical protein HOG08_02625, partial [Candidatus Magasanikbacteria bacterium]|nr:hypothetical protein [Candidatus Magasanikbacteria bacterium]